MRITFLLGGGFSLSGGDRVVATHAANLVKRGHSVTVASAPLRNPSFLRQIKNAIKIRATPFYKPNMTYFDGSGATCIVGKNPAGIDVAEIPDADVIIPTWWETSFVAQRLPPEKGAIVQFMQHYEVFDYTPKELVDEVWSMPVPKIVISQWLADIALDAGSDIEKISLVPNSVDTNLFNAPQRGKAAVPTIGFLYSIAPWKGVAVAEEAIARIAKWSGPLRVITFGHGRYELKLGENVFHTHYDSPPQTSLKSIYSDCDVWLSSSDAEGFCLPMLEAMACHTPVVATATGGPIDVIVDGYNGYIAAVRDSTTLGEHLVNVLRLSEGDWQAMSANAYATATSYSWEDATARFEGALIRALAVNPDR